MVAPRSSPLPWSLVQTLRGKLISGDNMFKQGKIEELQELVWKLEYDIKRVKSDVKGIYLFINMFVEKTEQDEHLLEEIRPILEDVARKLEIVSKGMKN
jgi:archaellum component FlaC